MRRLRGPALLALLAFAAFGCAHLRGVVQSYDVAPDGLERRESLLRATLATGAFDAARHQSEDGAGGHDELLRLLYRGTVAFYAGMRQYEPVFAAHGFQREARACQEGLERGGVAVAAQAISDEMVEHYVIVGTPDECRARVDRIWDVADSFCLVPPIGGLPPEQLMFYAGGIAETFWS